MKVKVIVYLIRKLLGLKKKELFQFVNQRSEKEAYYFTDDAVMKICEDGHVKKSNVSLNWLLDDRCHIHKIGGFTVHESETEV